MAKHQPIPSAELNSPELNFLNDFEKQQQFVEAMSNLSEQTKILDWVCSWAERNGLSVEVCSEFIKGNPPLLAKVAVAAERRRFLKPVRRLQI